MEKPTLGELHPQYYECWAVLKTGINVFCIRPHAKDMQQISTSFMATIGNKNMTTTINLKNLIGHICFSSQLGYPQAHEGGVGGLLQHLKCQFMTNSPNKPRLLPF